MSPAPLSHRLFPNIRPLEFPNVPHSSFPLAPNLFTSVHSLGLPSLVSSMHLPPLLQNIHRVLAPGGILHLTLINPTPSSATLGPKLQDWLTDKLIIPLERSFRCIWPTRLLPYMLGEAQLRAHGSSLTEVKFLAIPASRDDGSIDGSSTRRVRTDGKQDSLKEVKCEVRSIVGRMLWAEVYGSYIKCDRWWWDEPEIVEECRRLGTFWEYQIIEAVKEEWFLSFSCSTSLRLAALHHLGHYTSRQGVLMIRSWGREVHSGTVEQPTMTGSFLFCSWFLHRCWSFRTLDSGISFAHLT